ncbi:unnamed protein product [Orchesella dallaii]|uniref:Uncharacterized protein n=1 Tax=Orchesella dallaii TaxID=48710 RepID=A0ABP1RGG7_9HEXA
MLKFILFLFFFQGFQLYEHNLELPFRLDFDCFINLVKSNSTEFKLPIFVEDSSTHVFSYTLYHVAHLNFAFVEYDDEEQNVTSVDGYLRFFLRHRSKCLLFILFTPSLDESLLAIQESGHGASEEVLFIIPTEYDDEITNGFTTDLLFETAETPFHADLLFLQETNKSMDIFCLFCPNKLNSILENETELSFSTLKSECKKLKSSGYGHSLEYSVPLGALNKKEQKCFDMMLNQNPNDGFRLQLKYNVSFISTYCTILEVYVIASLQPILNISIFVDPKYLKNSDNLEWFLNVKQEGLIFRTPNKYLETRGWIMTVEGVIVDVMVCHDSKIFLVFDIKYTTLLDIPVRICIVGISFCYFLLHRSPIKVVDLLFAMFGKPLDFNYPRKFLLVYLIAVLFFSCCYQSNISSESIHMLQFPNMDHYVKSGYKLFTPRYKEVIGLVRNLPAALKKNIGKTFGAVDHAFYEGNEVNISRSNRDWFYHIEMTMKLKLFITSFIRPKIFRAITADIFYIREDTLCKVFHLSSNSSVPLSYRFRSWSYLSASFNRVLTRVINSGIYVGIKKLFYGINGKDMANLRIRPATAVVPIRALDMYSAIGVACLSHCGCVAFVFLVYLGIWVWVYFKHDKETYHLYEHNLELPISMDSDCFINLVKSNSTDFKLPTFLEGSSSFVFSYTLYHVAHLNFAFIDYDDSEQTVVLTDGYLRFFVLHRSKCILFILFTPTLAESLLAIQQSGHGASEEVLFIIPTEEDDEVTNGFTTDLLFETAETSFHADVLFFQGTNMPMDIFCLYCPKKLNPVLENEKELTFSTLKFKYKKLKSSGYGHSLEYTVHLGTLDQKEQKCFDVMLNPNPNDDFQFQQKHNISFISIYCYTLAVYAAASLQPILNISFGVDAKYLKNSDNPEWFLNVKQEGLFFESPNRYLTTRGWIIPFDDVTADVMEFSCVIHFFIRISLKHSIYSLLYSESL